MSELEPLSTPEELQATLSDTEPTELEQPESKVNRGGRKLGSKNLPKVDYDSRIENLISAMNMLIEKGELTATVERAYNRQIEYFQFQIQRRDDAKKESRERELAKIKELEAQPPLLVPPVPDAKSIESERRVAKMLKELGEERERKKARPV